ncbi:hypothetical protein CDAR_547501 [Caerostris darwini]|uniref:Uncharacterized protein n=1 Tax=Caerostris darwini TaxID=1538125 RepID=A0AAV4VC80_9ARAC|nr:hypothetical protein CDAR_547501 [Caerostris darwini]
MFGSVLRRQTTTSSSSSGSQERQRQRSLHARRQESTLGRIVLHVRNETYGDRSEILRDRHATLPAATLPEGLTIWELAFLQVDYQWSATAEPDQSQPGGYSGRFFCSTKRAIWLLLRTSAEKGFCQIE